MGFNYEASWHALGTVPHPRRPAGAMLIHWTSRHSVSPSPTTHFLPIPFPFTLLALRFYSLPSPYIFSFLTEFPMRRSFPPSPLHYTAPIHFLPRRITFPSSPPLFYTFSFIQLPYKTRFPLLLLLPSLTLLSPFRSGPFPSPPPLFFFLNFLPDHPLSSSWH